jgi:uncharacterized protein (TIGR02453 family)
MNHLQPSTFEFLKELAAHNTKEWMDENRKWYKQERALIIAFTNELYQSLATVDTMPLVDPKKSVARINNNRRFHPDKPLYKNNFGLMINRGEGKSMFYVHVSPGQSFLGGGIHSPMKEQLDAIRDYIDHDGPRLQKIVDAPGFKKYFGEISGSELKTAPRDFDKEHPYIHFIRKKDFTVMQNVSDGFFTKPNAIAEITNVYSKALPFLEYLDDALSVLKN